LLGEDRDGLSLLVGCPVIRKYRLHRAWLAWPFDVCGDPLSALV
jgi:hypothetical protein